MLLWKLAKPPVYTFADKIAEDERKVQKSAPVEPNHQPQPQVQQPQANPLMGMAMQAMALKPFM